MHQQNRITLQTAALALSLFVSGPVTAGSLNPTSAPSSTMRTLDEIYQKVQNLGSQTPQTLSAATPAVPAGYYAATNLAQIDADLAAGNIKTNVTLFGIAGTLATNAGSAYPAMAARTGVTNSLSANDDGAYQSGVAWPSPRFTIQAGGDCVLDNQTGLMWTRNGGSNGVFASFSAALTYCENLTCGGLSDWRMPNVREMASLMDYSANSPALPAGHSFTNLPDSANGIYYWTSTRVANLADYYWYLNLKDGQAYQPGTIYAGTVLAWPVRGP